jgi:hypothetical protein
MREPTMLHRLTAEFIGTFWLAFGGCGSAVFAAKFTSDGTSLGIGFLGVALAFGLTVLTGVYAFGTISGGHFNPAVTLGAALARRVEWKALPAYWITQVVAGLAADRQPCCRPSRICRGLRTQSSIAPSHDRLSRDVHPPGLSGNRSQSARRFGIA